MSTERNLGGNTNLRALRIGPLSECILYKLYHAHATDDLSSHYSVENIQEMLNGRVSKKLILSALDTLISGGTESRPTIKRVGKIDNYFFSVSIDGIYEVENSLTRRNSVATFLQNNPVTDIEEIAGFEGIFYNPIERLDLEEWQPLKIDRDSSDYHETLTELDSAVNIIRGDNGFAEKLPETRDGIVSSLQQGMAWLKSRDIPYFQIKNLILQPLQWVVINFSRTVSGEAAKKASERLVQYILSLFP